MDISSLPHVAYVLDALVYYIRNNPNASSQSKRSSVEKAVEVTDASNDDEGGDDVDDEDNANFKRESEECDDDTDHVDDEPMPTPSIPGHLHRLVWAKPSQRYCLRNTQSHLRKCKIMTR